MMARSAICSRTPLAHSAGQASDARFGQGETQTTALNDVSLEL